MCKVTQVVFLYNIFVSERSHTFLAFLKCNRLKTIVSRKNEAKNFNKTLKNSRIAIFIRSLFC
jgi:hypothetical protein